MIDQHNTLAEKFIKKGFWLYLFSFIIGPMGYIIKIIISQELSVSEVGILYGILSLMVLISAYNDLGLTESINYFIPKFVSENRYDKVKTILTYALIAQMCTGASIAAFFYFGADFISNHYFQNSLANETLKIFAIFFLGINLFQIISTFFMSVQNTFYNKLCEFFRMGFVVASTCYMYFSHIGSLENYSYSWVIGLYIGIIFAVYFFTKNYYLPYLKQEKVIWDKKLFFQIFKYSFSILLGTQASVILSQIDMQLILYILGAQDAGYYTNYLSIIGIPFLIIGPIFGFLFPLFSELQSKGEHEKIRYIKSLFQKYFLVVALAFSIFFFVFASQIVFVLFGTKFLPSAIILQYSIGFLCFNFLLQINFSILSGLGKAKERIIIIGSAIVLNTILNIIFIYYLGVQGSALATGIGWIFIWGFSEYYLGKKYASAFDWKYIVKSISILGSIGFFYWYSTIYFFTYNSRLQSFFLLIIYALIFATVFIFIHKRDFKIVIEEIKKIKKKENSISNESLGIE